MNEALDLAAAAYGLDPRGLTPVASAYRPAAAYRDVAAGILLKPYRYSERQLYYVTGALKHLEAARFRRVPQLVPARHGEPYIRLGGGLWYAVTWIDGRKPRLPDQLPAAMEALGQLHLAADGYGIPWRPSASWRRRWSSVLHDLEAFGRQAAAGRTAFDRAYARALPAFRRRAHEAYAALTRSDYDALAEALAGRQAFIHRDATCANLIRSGGDRMVWVDPDTFGLDLRLADIVRLLLSVGRFAGPSRGWPAPADLVTPARIMEALQAYESIAPLDPRERRLLPAALQLPREFWWAGACRYRKPAPGVDPARLLDDATAGAPARDACVRELMRLA